VSTEAPQLTPAAPATPSNGPVKPTTSVQRRFRELDGIRALAIIAVLINHFFANGLTLPASEGLKGPSKALFALADHGWLGVDLFFVLSGFLITGILLDSRGNKTYFQDFWIRRALRILPLVVVVVTTIAIVERPPWLLVGFALLFSLDIAPLFHTAGNNDLGPLWSLAVEEQFYLFWPFIILLCRWRSIAVIALCVICAEPIIRASFTGQIDLPWFRLDGLAMGALIAVYLRSRYFSPRNTLFACAICLAAIAGLGIVDLHVPAASRSIRITEFVLGFGILVAGAVTVPGHPWLAPLRSRAARFVADTSFCVYLIHVPLLDLTRWLGVGRDEADVFVAAAMQAAVALPVIFLAATLSRRYLELPFLRLKDRFAPPTMAVPPALRYKGSP
jgi:peptidoglycan/LPS O-acetylase OafA/YrhL